jgi:hypothetical protein
MDDTPNELSSSFDAYGSINVTTNWFGAIIILGPCPGYDCFSADGG